MTSTRKSRSGNKQFSDRPKMSPDKDDGNPNKSRQRKRKLSDLLGSQWSKGELERFYVAHRNYGKDWKKVANVVTNRSPEMVEALYNMNKAYLSLPEGTTSVVGLIAMVTDHYNVLEECDADQESNDASRLSQMPQKRRRGKVQFSALKEDPLLSQSVVPKNDGCLYLCNRLSDGWVTRKRTPRFPVSYSFRNDDNDNHVTSNSSQKEELDDDVEHVAALVLSEACQRGGLPQVSQSPLEKDHMTSLPSQSRLLHSEMGRSKILGPAVGKASLEVSLGFRVEENEGYAREISAFTNNKSFGALKVNKKGKKVHGKRRKSENIRIDHFGDDWKACSSTGNVLNDSDLKGEVGIEVSNPKMEQSSLDDTKRNKKLFFGDKNPALDALETLADLSLMMPTSTRESGSFVQLEETQTFDLAIRSIGHEAVSKQRKKTNFLVDREKVQHGFSGDEASTTERSKLGGDLATNVNAISEGEQHFLLANKPGKRKCKSSSLKASNKEDEKLLTKGRHTGRRLSPLKHGESIRPADYSSPSIDKRSLGNDSAVSTAEVPVKTHASLPSKQSRRKMVPGRIRSQKLMKSPGTTAEYQPKRYSIVERDDLSCCLSSSLVRRWCTFEWFYSAIDYAWYAKREFVEYLNHVGLGHIPRLSRVEWDVIRSSLGKPRRFSKVFLHEEKEKLKQYRESVRKHYAELRAGTRNGLPKDLACPLSVGQRVVAIHPKSREVHNGSVLTVDHDKCRIQFDRPDLGVEFVMDIDCMPSNPLENMPEALRRQSIGVDKLSPNSCKPCAGTSNTGESLVLSPNEHLENACGSNYILMNQADMACAISKAKAAKIDMVNAPQAAYSHPSMETHKQVREADIRALTKLTDAPNKKVSSAALNLRQCNMDEGNYLSPRLKPSATSVGFNGPTSYMGHHLNNYLDSVSESSAIEIVQDSRFKAQMMVDTAMQAMFSVKQGENAFERIAEALYGFDRQMFTPHCGLAVNGDIVQRHFSSSTSERLQKSDASATKLQNGCGRNEGEILSELITSCVATLLMVQTCTERHPLADVAQILDSAIRSLRPYSPQNLPIYRDIEMSMGRIKNQIRALVPT